MSSLAPTTQTRREFLTRVRQTAVIDRLFLPVDTAVLAYFRIAFGLIMLWEVVRYFDNGWITRYWVDPVVNFPYYGFGWLRPLPGMGMELLFAGLGLLAIFITLGFYYRLSAALFFVGFTYSFLLEQARYLNHFYLIILLSFLLIWLPLGRVYSLDARRAAHGSIQRAPAWTLWLLRVQIGIVYFYAGLAKLNADWLGGEPMRGWLAARTDFPLLGPFFTEEWLVYAFTYGGLLLDLLAVPLLLWRRTRPFAFAAALLFHLLNAKLFSIGIFPWFMIAATAVFFAPDWPRRVVAWLGCHCVLHPSIGAPKHHTSRSRPLVVGLLSVYLLVQLLLPLRHLLYAGDPSWTEEGHRYAWHMKLRDKSAEAVFHVVDGPTGQRWQVTPADYLPGWQANKVATHPHMIWQFAHFLAEEWHKQGITEVAVYAEVMASLNGRPPQPLIDPTVDLLAQTFSLRPSGWIVPLVRE
ncbi:MAG: HTTM domain-containing protein [Anaerolineae bacterium]|nr:HTTM domain-containing protein [Anaerolineae bacterium]